MLSYNIYSLLGLHQDVDLEDLIDDFTTFYTAGN